MNLKLLLDYVKTLIIPIEPEVTLKMPIEPEHTLILRLEYTKVLKL